MRLIDADALDETVQRLNEMGWGITRSEYKRIDGVLFEMPTVDAEPVRHGHWEYHTRHQRSCVVSCSMCRKRTTFFFKNGTKYCPFCGAKMAKEEE